MVRYRWIGVGGTVVTVRCRWIGVGGNRAGLAIRLVRALAGGVGFRWRRRCRRAAFLLVVASASGCFSPPRRVSELMGAPPAATVPSEGPAHVDEARVPVEDWKRSGDLDPRVVLGGGRRVVVTEFDVEFVDLQFQPPIPRQIKFKPPPIAPNPVHLATEVIGLGRRSSWLAEDQQQALASDLYNAFLQDLRRRGLVLVSQDDLHASPAYAGLCQTPVVKSSPLMVLNPIGSDTGIVMHTRTVAAPGLGVVKGGSHARAAAEARILAETHADVALAVRLRVGTFREHSALERRSLIRLTTCEGSTTLRACRSLVSDVTVIDETARIRPVAGRIEPLVSGMFSIELTAMLPKFIALALSEPLP